MPQSAAVRAAHEDDLPLLRREGNPRSHDFNSATLVGELSIAAGERVDLCLATVRMSLQSGRIGSPAWHYGLFR